MVNVSLATCGIAAGGLKALEALKDEVAKRRKTPGQWRASQSPIPTTPRGAHSD